MDSLEINHKRLQEFLDSYLPSPRRELVRAMYEDLGEKLYLAPASSTAHFHNAFPGGYLDHILRVTDFAIDTFNFWKDHGMQVSDISLENVVFTALHHDLGKLGFPGKGAENYIPNDSEWHKNKLGQIYKVNEQNPFMLIQDQSLFLLQYYNIPVEWVEYITIKIHDGLYDDVNKPYYISRSDASKLRTNLPHIIHQADLMAAHFEYEKWKASQGHLPVPPSIKPSTKSTTKAGKLTTLSDTGDEMMNAFKNLFGEG